MTDETALLTAVLDRPRDDTPRLVYADWLDDHGDPARAEFIRVQVELARWADYRPPPEIAEIASSDRLYAASAAALIVEKAAEHIARREALRRRERELWPLVTPTFGLPADWLVDVHPRGTDRSAVVRRGFIESITAPSLDVLFGGACGRCAGTGMSEREYHGATDDDGGCHDCSGTGRTPGIARDVFRAHPVTAVAVGDMEPESGWEVYGSLRLDQGDRFVWGRAAGNTASGELVPDEVWELLEGWVQKDGWWKSYPTRAAALDALSAAIVAHGRDLAGLSPLPERPAG